MKKTVLSIALALITLLFTGCSCSGAAVLSFDGLWGGKNDGYKETLLYSVEYKADYSEFSYSFVKSSDLSGVSIEITGTYTVENEILSTQSPDIPETVKNFETFSTEMTSVVKSTAKLELTASYTLGDDTKTSEDRIYSISYFYNDDAAFAPVYTEREFDYQYPYIINGEIKLSLIEGKDITEYFSKDKYKITKEYRNAKDAEYEKQENEYEYNYRGVIDNSALLLATRNKTIEKDASYTIPVVHPSYGQVSNLSLKHFEDTEKRITFDYNGEEKTVNFNLKAMNFVVYPTNSGCDTSSGTPQLVFVQNGEIDGINKSLMVEYVAPLVEYSGFNKIGALAYTLKSATYA